MEREKRVVTLSMVVLFFSLIVVYSLFYQIKGEKLINLLRSATDIEKSPQIQEDSQEKDQLLNLELTTGTLQDSWILEWEIYSDIATWTDALLVEAWWEQLASTGSRLVFEGESPVMLSGTDRYFGAIESIELLGLEPDYLLKDSKGFYYAKFAKEPQLKKTVQDLGGNIYTISSEADILKHQLFGDKVSFVNLPEYKNKLVLLLLATDGQYWLIQMDYNKYHHAKKYLKTLFIQ